MDIEDLMLGNVVRVKGCAAQFAVVSALDIEERAADVVLFNGEHMVYIIEEDIEGVEIERDYLLNNGFNKVEDWSCSMYAFYSKGNCSWYPNERILKVGQRDFACRYIHELQNILKITKYGK